MLWIVLNNLASTKGLEKLVKGDGLLNQLLLAMLGDPKLLVPGLHLDDAGDLRGCAHRASFYRHWDVHLPPQTRPPPPRSLPGRGRAQVEREEVQDLGVLHLREQALRTALEDVLRELLRVDQAVDLVLDRAPATNLWTSAFLTWPMRKDRRRRRSRDLIKTARAALLVCSVRAAIPTSSRCQVLAGSSQSDGRSSSIASKGSARGRSTSA